METPAYRVAVRKFYRRMLPLVVFMLVVNQMDRTNIGFVQSHFQTDLGIGAAAFGLGAGCWPTRRCSCCAGCSSPCR